MTIYEKEDKNKLEQYVDGHIDEDLNVYVESLFLNGEENPSLKSVMEKDWGKMIEEESNLGVDLTPILDKIHHIIRKKEGFKKQNSLQKFLRVYSRVAAILLLPILIAGGLGYNYISSQNKTLPEHPVNSTIYAPMGSRLSFNLPDGTTGMLNSGTSLSYSYPFNNNRKIKLEGEAWLDVMHDKSHPFEINTGNSVVKVLGTSLNVNAYPEENYVEVVLLNGKVEFFNNINQNKTFLNPSDRLIFRNGEVNLTVTDPEKYKAWTKGKLIFRGDQMSEVARRIERWYNVKVIIADKELNRYSFRATFQDDQLEDVIRILAMTSPITYKINPIEVMADGTVKKKEVTIYSKK